MKILDYARDKERHNTKVGIRKFVNGWKDKRKWKEAGEDIGEGLFLHLNILKIGSRAIMMIKTV
jgi:hypothetical protein